MNPADEARRKLPVWQALSDLFLDTELQADDYRRIARVLCGSGLGDAELEHILRWEVAPAFAANLLSVAGIWAPFSEDEVRERVGRQSRSAQPLRWLRHRLVKRHVDEEWAKISPLLAARRTDPAD